MLDIYMKTILFNEPSSLVKSNKIWYNQLKYLFDSTKSYPNQPENFLSTECEGIF